MPWDVIVLDEVVEWYERLLVESPHTAELVTAAIDLLEEYGPALGRPLVDTLRGSELPNLKELRPGSEGRTEIRILFAFDPQRRAILLTAGNKTGKWTEWYRQNISLAEERFEKWLSGDYG